MSVAEYIPINWGLIKSPVNWITVLLMLAFGAFAFDLAKMYYTQSKGSN